MPAESRRGPFSYDTLPRTGNAEYVLVKSTFNADNGEILEVIADGTVLVGDGTADSLSAANGMSPTAHGFYVDSLTSPTKITLVSNVDADKNVVIRRLSNRSTASVDFAPGSVIREQDLDNSTNQSINIAQEAIDIALLSIGEDVDGKYNVNSKILKNVPDGVDDNDAVNKSQLVATEVTTLAYKEDAEDYKLEAGDWAQKVNGAVKVYADNVVTGSDLGFSAKAHAIGGTGVDNATGSAKDWAMEVNGPPSDQAAEASAKEWAIGTSTHKNDGSAKSWAQDADQVDGATTNDRSAKAWSQGASMTGATLGGSSKDWANTLVTQIDGTNYSAKENATGVTTTLGSAKQWALGGGSFVEATEVTSGLYSARKYASDASASETAAANSAAAVSQVYDSFNDVYLGSMRTDKSSADAVTLSNASWAKDSSSIAFTGISSGTVTIGQELTSTGSGYPVDANIIGTQLTTPIVISKPFTVASPSPQTLVFEGTGIYGAFNSGTGGPSTNNDGDALLSGNLYFNSQENEMRIFDGANWIAATAVGQTSLLEYKFVTTSGQVSSKTYSGAADVGGTLSYTQSNIIVFMNGVQLKDTTDYTATNGSSVVLVAAPVLNDEINVIAFKSFTTADMVSASNGGTFSSAVTFSAVPVFSAGVGAITGTSLNVSEGNITNVGDIALDTITADGSSITVNTDTALAAGVDLETSTTGKIKQKGAFMQSSTHQALTLGG